MSHSLTATTPTSPAAAATNLAPSLPDGGDFRTASSLYSAFQAILNLASIAAKFVTGGTIGDGTGTPAILNNEFQTAANKDIRSGQDVLSARDVDAPRDLFWGRTLTGFQASIAGSVSFFNSGRITPRCVQYTTGATHTASVALGSEYFYPSGAAASTTTIDDTEAVDGDVMEFSTQEATHVMAIHAPGGGSIINLQLAGGQYATVRVVRISGTWTATQVIKA